MKRGVWCGLVLAAGMLGKVGLACAQEQAGAVEIAELRNQVVGSMRLTGILAVRADGTIAGYAIKHAEKVPEEVLQHLARHVPHWRVAENADGAGDKYFSVHVLATPRGDGFFVLSLAGASILGKQQSEEIPVADGRRKRPDYPRYFARAGVGGTVHMAAKVGRDGKVEDLVSEQVNLNFVGPNTEMIQARADFAAHSAAAVRQWKFRWPQTGPYIDQPFLVVRVSFNYQIRAQKYAQWEYYVPGPRRVLPWIEGQESDMALGTGEAGMPQLLGAGLQLATSLEPLSADSGM